MNPLFTTITEQEFNTNFEFIISLVQRGSSFYVKTKEDKLLAVIPINDPIAQSLIQDKEIQSELEETLKEFNDGSVAERFNAEDC